MHPHLITVPMHVILGSNQFDLQILWIIKSRKPLLESKA